MITDRDDLYELAIDVHDCAGSLRRGAGLPRFAGWNFRASELQGAVARVQLDAPRRPARAHAREPGRLAERVEAPPGPDAAARERRRRRRRHLPDRLRATRPTLAADAVEALQGRRASPRCGSTTRRSPTSTSTRTGPRCSTHLEAGRPAPDCPRTLELLERSIHVDLSPLLDEQDVDELALAFEKVARGILA